MPVLKSTALLLLATAACSFTPGTLAPEDGRRQGDGGGGVGDAAADTTVPPDAATSFVFEAEAADSFVSLDGTSSWTTETAIAGFSGAGYVRALPSNTGPCGPFDPVCGALATYNFDVAVAGNYRVTLRHYSENGCCDSAYWSIGFNAVTDDFAPDVTTLWTDDSTPASVPLATGSTALLMRIREPGARVDRISIELE